MTGVKLKKHLQDLVSKSKLETAIAEVLNYAKKCGKEDLRKDITQLSGRYHLNEKDLSAGKITHPTWEITRNQIAHGLLNLINSEDFEDCRKRYWWALVVIAVLGFLVFIVFREMQQPLPPLPLMKKIPEGKYSVGTPREKYQALAQEFNIGSQNFEGDLPLIEFTTPGFAISEYEVSVEEYARFLADKEYPQPSNWVEQKKHKKHPVTMVSVRDANEYCSWLSRKKKASFRLPREEEWEIAASGREKRTFPWGETFPQPEQINLYGHFNDIGDVGAFPTDNSDFEVKCMGGNVAEWCSSPCTGSFIARGGHWDDRHSTFLRCASRRCWPDSISAFVGFRIVQLP